MTKKVLVTDYVWPTLDPERKVLDAVGAELVVAPDASENTLASLAKDVDGILTCFAKVTEKVVRSAEKCTVISRFGVGVDNIDVDTATELGILVTYVPDYCVEEVSDHVIAMLLSWNRRLVLLDRATKTKGWGSEGLGMRIMRLSDKKLGIVGFGRIGRSVCAKARAFGLEILVSDPFITAEAASKEGATKVEFLDLLSLSDFVTLHSPLIPDTENMMGRTEFTKMKSDAFLINCARGGLIDENDLYNALTSGSIAGAGLDVLVDTDPALDHPLIQLGNTIVTPHTAFFSQESVLELEKRAAGEVVRVFRNRMPDNVYNRAVLPHARTTFVAD